MLAPSIAAAKAPSEEEEAAELIARGAALYKEGSFGRAAESFLEAYALVKRPVQLRNAAKSYEQAGRLAEAEATWQRLLTAPGVTAQDEAEAREHLVALAHARHEAPAARPAPAPVVVPTADPPRPLPRASPPRRPPELAHREPPPPPQEPTPIASWLLYGTSAALAISSGIVFYQAKRHEDQLEELSSIKDAQGRIVGLSYEQTRDREHQISVEHTASLALLGSGVAAAGLATVLLLLTGDGPPAPAATGPISGLGLAF